MWVETWRGGENAGCACQACVPEVSEDISAIGSLTAIAGLWMLTVDWGALESPDSDAAQH